MAEIETFAEADFDTGENTNMRQEFFGDPDAKIVTVYISNIPRDLDEKGLYNLLLMCTGKVVSLRITKNSVGKRIAFAEFSSIRELMEVIQELNNKPPLYMRVEVSKQRTHGGLKQSEHTTPTFAPPVYRPPSGIEPQATWSVGRGVAIRKASAVHRAYRNHLQSRMVHNTDMWSPGPADVYSVDKLMHVPQNVHEEVNLKLLSSLQMPRPDNRRSISMGRGYYVYPKRSPSKTSNTLNHSNNNLSVSRNTNEYIHNVSNGVYSFGEDPKAPAIPCTFCETLTVKKCYECGTPYCSEYCQTQDWDKHKKQCRLKVSIDVTFDAVKGDRRLISFKPLSDPIEVVVTVQDKVSTSSHSRASVVDAMRVNVNKEGVFEVSKCSSEAKAVYGTLCCCAGEDAMRSLVIGLPKAVQSVPPVPGFNPVKGSLVAVRYQDGWWRGTVMSMPSANYNEYQVGLVELSKIVKVTKHDIRPLPSEYANIPDFGVKGTVIRSNVQEKDLWSKYLQVQSDVRVFVESSQGSVVICNVRSEEGMNICQMQFQRWDPLVYRRENQIVNLTSGCRVVLTSYHNQHALFVRPTGKKHVELRNTVLQQVAACHVTGSPLKKPPRRDEMVACKCLQDGNYYRAIVHEASTERLGKYKVWFVDFGNYAEVEIEQMKPLSDDLKNYQFLAVKVSLKGVSHDKLTTSAAEYLNDLLDKEEVLRIEYRGSIDDGVTLISRDGTDVNKKLNSLLLPSWKINCTEIYEDKIYMLEDLVPLPLIEQGEAAEVAVIILHVKTEGEFAVFCCPAESPVVPEVLTSLNAQMNEFCESPVSNNCYNPRRNEICLARHQDGSWQRALSVGSIHGGSRVVFLDFGCTENVLFRDMRRILSDFIEMPTLLSTCRIRGLPTKLTDELKEKLKELLKPNTVVKLQRVKAVERAVNEYVVDLPEVLSALRTEKLLL